MRCSTRALVSPDEQVILRANFHDWRFQPSYGAWSASAGRGQPDNPDGMRGHWIQNSKSSL
jgi:hypothetical protein